MESQQLGNPVDHWAKAESSVKDFDSLEHELRESQQRQALLFEQNPVPTVEWNFDLEIIAWNAAAEHLFGYCKQEAIGQTIPDLFVPESNRTQTKQILQAQAQQLVPGSTCHQHLTQKGLELSCEWCHIPITAAQGRAKGMISWLKVIPPTTKIVARSSRFVSLTTPDGQETMLTQQALKRSNTFLKAQGEAALDGILAIDDNRKVAFYNWHFCELWKIPQWLLDTKDDHQLLKFILGQLEQPQEFLTKVEYLYQHPSETSHDEVLCKDGRIFERSSVPVESEQGEHYGRIWYFRDISDRKAAEEAQRTSQQRWGLFFDQTPLAIIEWNTRFEVVNWNPAAEQIFGYSQEEVLGRYFDFLVPEVVRPHVSQVLDDLLAQRGGTRSTNENITKDNHTIICEWYNKPLVSKSGETISITSAVMDVTNRKRAELELRQAKEAAETALYELQQTQAHLVQSEKMSALGELVAGVAHEINNPVNFIYGNLSHADEYTQDFLRLLKLYQAHYPNPVAAIQSEAEAIDLDFLMEDLPKLLNSMKVGAERIQKIVISLRNFSRMDEAEFKAVDIHEGIDNTLMILQNRLKAQSDRPEIKVIKHYSSLPPIECYAGQLNQVFMNLLSNALDALEERDEKRSQTAINESPSSICITTELTQPGWIAIRIADNGSGIPSNVYERIFDPFFTTKSIGKGTGMGLSISYQIVHDRHHGKLECSSTPGQGAEFTIHLPLKQPQELTK